MIVVDDGRFAQAVRQVAGCGTGVDVISTTSAARTLPRTPDCRAVGHNEQKEG
ncbi:hypothetical protein [Aeromicrobium sp. P5_D10]